MKTLIGEMTMVLKKIRPIEIGQILRLAVEALALFGVWITVRATWVVTHGGDTGYGGMFNYPTWSLVHFIAAFAFIVILPFQLWPGSRRSFPRAHRLAGRIAAAAGVLFSLTGLVLPFVMPARPFGEQTFMATVACVFPVVLARGVVAARRLNFVTHRRWMLRVTALALGPLTQRVILPLFAATGIDGPTRFWDLFTTAAWFSLALNVLIVEWCLRRTPGRAAEASPFEPRPVATAIWASRAALALQSTPGEGRYGSMRSMRKRLRQEF
jgi:hypothetical protein